MSLQKLHLVDKPAQGAMSCQGIRYSILDLSVPTELDEFETFCAQSALNSSLRISLRPVGDCAQDCHFRIAESQFLCMTWKFATVSAVDYVYNATLRQRFLQKKEEFKMLKSPQEERFVVNCAMAAAETDIIAFKGFPADARVYTVFDPTAFEQGSAGNKTALLCLALLGIEGKDHEQSYEGYGPNLKINNGDQLLPKYLVHFY